MNITSTDIKIAVLSYYRYKKQAISADEVGFILGRTDISVYKRGILAEIEIKTSKYDIWHGEKIKTPKHAIYRTLNFNVNGRRYTIPNYFYMCVPTELLAEAEKFVLTINEKYGILSYNESKHSYSWANDMSQMISVYKKAHILHTESHKTALNKIASRLSSHNIILQQKLKNIQQEYQKIYQELKEIKNGGRSSIST